MENNNITIDSLLSDSFFTCPLGGAVYNKEGRLVDINKAIYTRFALSRKEDFVVANLFDNLALSHDQKVSLRNGDSISSEEPVSFKVEPIFQNSNIIDGYTLWLVQQEGWEVERENKLLTGQLNESRMLMRLALEDGKFAAYSFSFDRFNSCDKIHCNRCFQFYGVTNTLLDKNRFICRALSSVRKQEDRLDFFYLFNKIHDERLPDYSVVFHLKNEDGVYKIYEVTGKGVEADGEGYPHVILGSIKEKEGMAEEIAILSGTHDFDRLKSNFLANITHEIRTPLNAIVGFSDILGLEDDPENREEYIRLIKQNNHVLLELVNDMLEMSKIESNMISWSFEDVPLWALMLDIHENVDSLVNRDVRLILDESPDLSLHTDKFKLFLIFRKLLKNAIRFTKKGEIHYGFKSLYPVSILFYVSDTGCGIPQKDLGRIFDKFVQLDAFENGTGLGLSICRGLVMALGGSIWVSSEEGKGTTFNFELPIKQD